MGLSDLLGLRGGGSKSPLQSPSAQLQLQQPRKAAGSDALAAAALGAGGSSSSSSSAKMQQQEVVCGMALRPGRDVVDVDASCMGMPQQLQVTPITLVQTDYRLQVTHQVAVNASHICYGLKQGHIRVLNRATGTRALLKGHTTLVTDMRFCSAGSDLLASCDASGAVYVRKLPDRPNSTTIQDEVLASFKLCVAECATRHLAWHPHVANLLAVAAADRVAFIKVPSSLGLTGAPEDALPVQSARPALGANSGVLTSLAFSFCGAMLAAITSHGSVLVWELAGDLASEQQLEPLEPAPSLSFQALGSAHALSAAPAPGAGASTGLDFLPSSAVRAVLIVSSPSADCLELWALHTQPPGASPGSSLRVERTYQLLLQSSAGGPGAFFNHMLVQPSFGVVVLANTKRKQVYVVHAHQDAESGAASFDYLCAFQVQYPILSMTTLTEPSASAHSLPASPPRYMLMSLQQQQQQQRANHEQEQRDLGAAGQEFHVFCVQTEAIQQYTLSPSTCRTAPEQELALLQAQVSSQPCTTRMAGAAPPGAAGASVAESRSAAEVVSTPSSGAAGAQAPLGGPAPYSPSSSSSGSSIEAQALSSASSKRPRSERETDHPVAVPAPKGLLSRMGSNTEDSAVATSSPKAAALPIARTMHSSTAHPSQPFQPQLQRQPAGAPAPVGNVGGSNGGGSAPFGADLESAAQQHTLAPLTGGHKEVLAPLCAEHKAEFKAQPMALETAAKLAVESAMRAWEQRGLDVSMRTAALVTEELGSKMEGLHKQLPAQIAASMRATLLELLPATAQPALDKALAAALPKAMVDCTRHCFASTVVPAMERATQAMLAQIELAGKASAAELAAPAREAARTLERAQAQAGSIAGAMHAELASLRSEAAAVRSEAVAAREAAARAAAAAVEAAASAAATAAYASTCTTSSLQEAGDSSSSKTKQAAAPADPRTRINTLWGESNYDAAFALALESSSDVLVWLLRKEPPQAVLGVEPCPLSAGVLLSLLMHLAHGVRLDPELKLRWVLEVATCLDPQHPQAVPHTRSVLEPTKVQLQAFAKEASGGVLRLAKTAVHLINSLLHQ